MKTKKQLINNIIGQLNGINAMLDNEEDCFKTLTQLKAAKSALSSITNKFLQENFIKCMKSCSSDEKSHEEICEKFFKEILR